ncbi:sugar ABC transporter substrate-binding protein, partial [Streptomyces ipomoeae]
MKLPRARSTITAASAVLAVLALTTACNRESDASTSADGGKAAIGIDLPRSDTDFWNSYAEYLKKDIKAEGANALPISNSQNDVTKLVSNVQVFENTGAKAIVMAPQDTGAIASTLDTLASKKIPVISVDTRPDKGDVYMVVRADNRAYGTKACEYLGKQLGGKGKVAEFQGALDSINGRDRSEAFAECMKEKFPKIKVFELPTDWKGDVASAKLQSLLA